MDSPKRPSEIQDAIRRVLYEDWDPIGVSGIAPRDEYDAYIGGVYRILASSSPRQEDAIVEFLGRMESSHMGLPRSDDRRLREVARKLLSIPIRGLSDDA